MCFCAPALLLLLGCSEGAEFRRYGGNTMGTYYQVTARCPEDVAGPIEDTLRQVNAEMSTYLPDSTLSRFNSAPPGDWFAVPASLAEVVAAAEDLAKRSGGAFDVTVGPLVNLWGFGAEAAATPAATPPTDAAVAATLERIGHRFLSVRRQPPALRKSVGLYVDLSAIAKGHGVDRVVARLEQAGCDAMLVDIGGEVRGRGASPAGRPWRIGIEVPDPGQIGAVQRVIQVEGAAVATSGDYRNFRETEGRRVSHTIDPRTGYPVDHGLASVTVVHASAMWADGYATLLNVLGPEAGLAFARQHELAALLIVRREDGFEERYTDAFEALLVM
jgi:thiamine biosynthesis lipoprotein